MVLDVKGKAERARQRTELGKLARVVIKERTEERYMSALRMFFIFLKEERRIFPK